jgi:bacterioferritin
MSPFQIDLEAIHASARAHLNSGPVTTTYGADVAAVIKVMNDVLATEIVCWLRYQQHATVAAGINSASVVAEFTEHASEELQHALSVAVRIDQLGGSPDLDPAGLVSRSQTEYRTYRDVDLEGMLRDNLVAERIVIETYQEIIRWLGDGDPTTRRLMETILEQEEEHASDLGDLLGELTVDAK